MGVLDVTWSQTDRLAAVGSAPGHPVQLASADGLDLDDGPTTNLTPPVTAVAAAQDRPTLVVDQGGLWSLPADGADGGDVWRSVPGGRTRRCPRIRGRRALWTDRRSSTGDLVTLAGRAPAARASRTC